MTYTLTNAYAVIIGVDENSLPRLALPTVAKDVQAMYDVLTHPQRCGYDPENVKLYQGAEVTRDNIFEAFIWLQDRVKEDQDATAVVYYSGHGMVDRLSDQYYLIPYDVGEMRRIRQRAIKAEELGAEIAALQPERLLVILDCCHAAGMAVKDVDLHGQDVTPAAFPLDLPQMKAIPNLEASAKNMDQLATGSGRAVLNSSTGSESSYIREDRAMSVFTYHLIEALTGHAPYDKGDATVLVTDVMSYVTRRVAETAREEGRQQTPVMRTTGVFPVARILGGAGVAKGMAPPDPLEPLPERQEGTQVSIEGSGAAAVGEGATAVGERGVNVVGNVEGGVDTGDTNTVFNQQDQTVHGPQVQARNVSIDHLGNNIFSGDYRGAILNVHNTLSDVSQTISTLPAAGDDAKAELERLVTQLEEALERTVAAAPEKAEEAEAVSDKTESLVSAASSEQPNTALVQVTGDGLKQAARNLADVTPTVLDIATRIVTVIAAFAT